MRTTLTSPIDFKSDGEAPDPLEVQSRLEHAIRSGDLEGVQNALAAGATGNCCTLDQDGYHTSAELALKYGHPTIAKVVAAKATQSS